MRYPAQLGVCFLALVPSIVTGQEGNRSAPASAPASKKPAPTFFWDMESESAVGYEGEKQAFHYAKSGLSKDGGAGGSPTSLKVEDTWAAATFNNPTDNPVWCPVTVGTIEFDWKYLEPLESCMLFQITGKSKSKDLDTDDGIGLKLRMGASPEFYLGMGWDNAQQTARVRYNPKTALVPGQWYHITVKYRVGGSPSLFLQIGDSEPVTSDAPLGATAAKAWHQILIGNDTRGQGTQYFDNFTVYPEWVE